MRRPAMTSYEAARDGFRWAVPETFNFGADVVDRWAADRPDQPALIWCDAVGAERRFSFADIARASNRFANLLRQAGVRQGDRVVICLPRIPEWQIAMVGALKLGAVPIPCITMLTAKDLAYRIGHSGAVAAVTTAAETGKFAGVEGLVARISVGAAAGWTEFAAAEACGETFAAARLAAEDVAVLYYTSGSSGAPKGVAMASRALFAWRVSAWYWPALTEHDVMWCTADTGWSKAGTSILFGPWSCGTPVLFHDGPFDPARRFALIERHRVTVFCAAATELRRLLDAGTGGRDLSALRLTISAGETVDAALVRRWRDALGVELLDGYGQTETLMTVLNYLGTEIRPGSMGRPCPGTEIAVLDEDGREVRTGEVGTLAIRLPNPAVMLGYWNAPERTAEIRLRVGDREYQSTGDLVRVDRDGYVYYEGRADDVISSAGYRIGPMEIESALLEHPAVLECAAIGSPDAERGEVVKAFVVLRPGFTGTPALAAELQEHAKRTTAPYKYPRRIAFVDALPKTPVGKVRRRELRDREWGTADG